MFEVTNSIGCKWFHASIKIRHSRMIPCISNSSRYAYNLESKNTNKHKEHTCTKNTPKTCVTYEQSWIVKTDMCFIQIKCKTYRKIFAPNGLRIQWAHKPAGYPRNSWWNVIDSTLTHPRRAIACKWKLVKLGLLVSGWKGLSLAHMWKSNRHTVSWGCFTIRLLILQSMLMW